MRVKIIIPTTNGPSVVHGITRLFRLPLSQVVTIDDFVPDIELTRRYHALTDIGGPLRDLIDLADSRYELCLDTKPEMGRSWELPVAIAHWALDRGHELVTDEADLVVWATGVIGTGGKITPEDYHISRKLDAMEDKLANWLQGKKEALFLLPVNTEPNELHMLESAGRKPVVVASVQEAFSYLDKGSISCKEGGALPPPMTVQKSKLGIFLGGGSLLFLVFFLAQSFPFPRLLSSFDSIESSVADTHTRAVGLDDKGRNTIIDSRIVNRKPDLGSSETSLETDFPDLQIIELRSQEGVSCANIVFETGVGRTNSLKATSRRFPSSSIDGLCGLGFALNGKNIGVVVLPENLLSLMLPSDRSSSFVVSSFRGKSLRFIQGRAKPLSYSILLELDSSDSVLEFHHELTDKFSN